MPVKRFDGDIQNLLAMLFEVIELPAVQCPCEHDEDAQYQHGRHGDEKVEYFHGAMPNVSDVKGAAS